jgi:PhnB protein
MKEIVTYLNFDGNCHEAMQFYGKCLGAELEMTPFSAMPGNPSPDAKERIMHAHLSKGPCTFLMASDTRPRMPFQQIDKLFAALSEKGKVTMPLQDMCFGARSLACSPTTSASIGCSTSTTRKKHRP